MLGARSTDLQHGARGGVRGDLEGNAKEGANVTQILDGKGRQRPHPHARHILRPELQAESAAERGRERKKKEKISEVATERQNRGSTTRETTAYHMTCGQRAISSATVCWCSVSMQPARRISSRTRVAARSPAISKKEPSARTLFKHVCESTVLAVTGLGQTMQRHHAKPKTDASKIR